MKKSGCCIIVFFAMLTFLCSCGDSANTQNINPQLLKWVDNISGPMYLPIEWPPIEKDTGDVHFYLRGLEPEDNVQIEAYQVTSSINFNDETELLLQNGPVSEAEFAGSITRNQGNNEEIYLPDDLPDNVESFYLADGVIAYKSPDGFTIWWELDGWKFIARYNMLPSDFDEIKTLVYAWENQDAPIRDRGKADITISNRAAITFSWNEGEYSYDFKIADTEEDIDFSSIISWLNSFSLVTE